MLSRLNYALMIEVGKIGNINAAPGQLSVKVGWTEPLRCSHEPCCAELALSEITGMDARVMSWSPNENLCFTALVGKY